VAAEEVGEEEVAGVVGAELGLAVGARHDGGVVDEAVDGDVELLDIGRGLSHRGLAAEVEVDERGLGSRELFVDLVGQRFGLGLGAAGEDEQSGLPFRERKGSLGTDAPGTWAGGKDSDIGSA
jgi:hypothetical protein